MEIGFYFDQQRCTRCFTCIVACKDWNDVPPGPASWGRVITMEKGKYPNLLVAFISIACFHCKKPTCVYACPANAISKREWDSIVVVGREACLGKENCLLCLQVCPYDSPQFGAEENTYMQKCHLCLDRLMENKKPVCIDVCPMRALDAGPMGELRAKYGDIREAEGFVCSEKLGPSIVFRPKRDREGLAIHKVEIAPLPTTAYKSKRARKIVKGG